MSPTTRIRRRHRRHSAGARRHRWRPRGIGGLLVRRTLLGLLTLFLVSVVVFAATQALPSDPARAILGRFATPESLAAVREQLHLDQPAVLQYLAWLGDLLRGDLGSSLAGTGAPVTAVIGNRVENSAVLVGLAAAVSIPLSILLGVLAATRRDRRFDHVSSVALLGLAALPEFVVAILLVVLLGTTVVHLFPPVSLIPVGELPLLHPKYLVLPALTLVIGVTPYTARVMRASMVEVLESDYIEMARLKGLPERRVVWRHALPNALAPTLQVIALNLAYLAGGIVPVEFVFTYPGVGTAFVDAVSNRDLPVVQALALLFAAVGIALYVLADVLSILVSPRVRTALR
jgi:peptide/nickel transport system permease protein